LQQPLQELQIRRTRNPLSKEKTTMKYFMPALCLAFALGIGAANAETKSDTKSETKTAPKARSAKAIECSKLADQKGLHGKERQVFRSKCKRGES
jgi:hypothetical protein